MDAVVVVAFRLPLLEARVTPSALENPPGSSMRESTNRPRRLFSRLASLKRVLLVGGVVLGTWSLADAARPAIEGERMRPREASTAPDRVEAARDGSRSGESPEAVTLPAPSGATGLASVSADTVTRVLLPSASVSIPFSATGNGNYSNFTVTASCGGGTIPYPGSYSTCGVNPGSVWVQAGYSQRVDVALTTGALGQYDSVGVGLWSRNSFSGGYQLEAKAYQRFRVGQSYTPLVSPQDTIVWAAVGRSRTERFSVRGIGNSSGSYEAFAECPASVANCRVQFPGVAVGGYAIDGTLSYVPTAIAAGDTIRVIVRTTASNAWGARADTAVLRVFGYDPADPSGYGVGPMIDAGATPAKAGTAGVDPVAVPFWIQNLSATARRTFYYSVGCGSLSAVACTPKDGAVALDPLQKGAVPFEVRPDGSSGSSQLLLTARVRDAATDQWYQDTASARVWLAAVPLADPAMTLQVQDTVVAAQVLTTKDVSFTIRNLDQRSPIGVWVTASCSGNLVCLASTQSFFVPANGTVSAISQVLPNSYGQSGVLLLSATTGDQTGATFAASASVRVWGGTVPPSPLPARPLVLSPSSAVSWAPPNTMGSATFFLKNVTGRTLAPTVTANCGTYQPYLDGSPAACYVSKQFTVLLGGDSGAVTLQYPTGSFVGTDSLRIVASVMDTVSGLPRREEGVVVANIGSSPPPPTGPTVAIVPKTDTIQVTGSGQYVLRVDNKWQYAFTPTLSFVCSGFPPVDPESGTGGCFLQSSPGSIPAGGSGYAVVRYDATGMQGAGSVQLIAQYGGRADTARIVASPFTPPITAAPVEVTPKRDFTVDIPAENADSATTTFTVKNLTRAARTFTLTLICDQFTAGTPGCGAPATVGVLGGASVRVTTLLRFAVPQSKGRMRLVARVLEPSTNTWWADTGTVDITVGNPLRLAVSPRSRTLTVPPAQARTDTFTVSNLGVAPTSIRVQADCGAFASPECEAKPDYEFMLPPGRSQVATLRSRAPATNGATARLALSATPAQGFADTARLDVTAADNTAPWINVVGIAPFQTVTSPATDVTVQFCDPDGWLATPTVSLNGTALPSRLVRATYPGCRDFGTATYTLTPTPGFANTLIASVTDGYHPVQASLTFGFDVAPSQSASVIPRIQTSYVVEGAVASDTFTIRNPGNRTSSYALTASCGTLLASSCAVAPTMTTLLPGASQTAVVAYSVRAGTAGPPAVADTISVQARYVGGLSTVIATGKAQRTGVRDRLPYIKVLSPSGDITTSVGTTSVAVYWCEPYGVSGGASANPLTERKVSLNGVTLPTRYQQLSPTSGCRVFGVSTYSGQPLVPGPQELTAEASSNGMVVSQATSRITFIPPTSSFALTVTPKATREWVPRNAATATKAFVVRNTGSYATAVDYVASCAAFINCTPSRASASIPVGAADTVTIAFTTPDRLGDTATIRLVAAARLPFNGVVADTGTLVVSTPTAARLAQPSVTPGNSPIVNWPNAVTLAYFLVTNTGTDTATYGLGWQFPAGFTPRYTPKTELRVPPGETVLHAENIVSDGVNGRVDSLRLAAAARIEGQRVADTGSAEVRTLYPRPSLSLSPRSGLVSAPPGKSHEWWVTAVNTGNVNLNNVRFRVACEGAVSNCRIALPTGNYADTVVFGDVELQNELQLIVSYDASLDYPAGRIRIYAVGTVQAVTDSARFDVAIQGVPVYSVRVDPANLKISTVPGGIGTRAFTITNTGSAASAYTYAVNCTPASLCTAQPPAGTTAELSPGASATIPATPWRALSAGTGTIGVVVTSTRNEYFTTSGTVTIIPDMTAPVEIRTRGLNPGVSIARDQCLTVSVGLDAAYECGDLRLVHALPATTTYSQARTPALIYNSRHASGSALVTGEVRAAPGILLDSVQLWVSVKSAPAVRVHTYRWNPGWNEGEPRRVTVPLDAAVGVEPATGLYPFMIEARGFSNGQAVAPSATSSDTVVVVNRSRSTFGAGWWLDGLEQLLVDNTAGTVLWIGGDGSSRLYVKQAGTANPTVWLGRPNVDRPDSLTLESDGRYSRHLRNGAVVRFDAAGRHVATRTRNGLETTFDYLGGALQAISLPVRGGAIPTYSFIYDTLASGAPRALAEVRAPSLPGLENLRKVTLTNPTGAIQKITDPDLGQVRFGIGTAQQITLRINRRGDSTNFRYDEAKLLRESEIVLQDSGSTLRRTAVTTFCPAESRGLTTCAPGAVHPSEVTTTMNGPRVEADIWTFFLNRFGGPDTVINPLGDTTRIVRNATWPVLPDTVRLPSGFRTAATYDPARALVKTVTAVDPLGPGTSATTTYNWHSRWDQLNSAAPPAGPTTSYSYDSYGNRQEVKVGTVVTRFEYLDRGALGKGPLVTAVVAADSTKDRFTYDPTLGNLIETRSPLGIVATVYRDEIGRATRSGRPIHGTLRDSTETVLDISDQVLTSKRIAGSDWHLVTNGYDPEGNLRSVRQQMSPDPNGLGVIERRFDYDAMGRQIREYTPIAGGTVTIPSTYDEAGNLIAGGRSAPGTSIGYDLLNRVVSRAGAANATYHYDANGNMILADNDNARIRRGYYPNGLLRADTTYLVTGDRTSWDQHRYILSYTYDAAGRRKAMTHPSQLLGNWGRTETQYDYDLGTGSLGTITGIAGTQFRFMYDTLGRLVSTSGPGSLREGRKYDGDSRVIERVVRRTASDSSVDTIKYDALGRVVKAKYDSVAYAPLGPVVYMDAVVTEQGVLDPLGNRYSFRTQDNTGPAALTVSKYWPGTTQLATSSVANIGGLGDTTEYLYDDFGNQYQSEQKTSAPDEFGVEPRFVARRLAKSEFDGANRMRRYETLSDTTVGAVDLTWRYRTLSHYRTDALGRRVWYSTARDTKCFHVDPTSGCDFSMVPTVTTTRVVWDGAEILYEIRNRGVLSDLEDLPGSALETEGSMDTKSGVVGYLHGVTIDKPLEIVKGDAVILPLYDWRGLIVSGLCGAVVCTDQQALFPQGRAGLFGQPIARRGITNWIGSLVEGQRDEGSGLTYQRNRYVDPSNGRFTQEDPIGLRGGLNVYGFAGGDPVNHSDPFGLCPLPPWSCLAGAGAGGGAVAIGTGVTLSGGVSAGAAVAVTAPAAALALGLSVWARQPVRPVAAGRQISGALVASDATAVASQRHGSKIRAGLIGIALGGSLIFGDPNVGQVDSTDPTKTGAGSPDAEAVPATDKKPRGKQKPKDDQPGGSSDS